MEQPFNGGIPGAANQLAKKVRDPLDDRIDICFRAHKLDHVVHRGGVRRRQVNLDVGVACLDRFVEVNFAEIAGQLFGESGRARKSQLVNVLRVGLLHDS